MKRVRLKTALWRVVIALTVLFIWGQSLLRQDLSRTQSESIQHLFGNLFGEQVYESFLVLNIRKVAHFAEYALLGAEWMGYRLSLPSVKPTARWALWCFGLVVAVCDELLQFITDRAPMFTDVLLDCAGYVCGIAVIFGVLLGIKQLRKQKSAE